MSLLAVVLAAVAVSAPSPADQVRAHALVVGRADVPAAWDTTIDPNPCPLTGATVGAVRAATRWGSPTHGVWSVAAVFPSSAAAASAFARVSGGLPLCVQRLARFGGFAPASSGLLGNERVHFTATLGDDHVDLIAVRAGRSLVFGIYGTAPLRDPLALVRAELARG